MVVAACTNIGLDLLFVMEFHWGIAGAALATLVAGGFLPLLLCRHPQDSFPTAGPPGLRLTGAVGYGHTYGIRDGGVLHAGIRRHAASTAYGAGRDILYGDPGMVRGLCAPCVCIL